MNSAIILKGECKMTKVEDEQLFLDLAVFDGLTQSRIEELRQTGYLDSEYENTEKAESFIRLFVDERSDSVVKTLEEQGNYFKDKGKVMFSAGLKNQMAMDIVMEHLSYRMQIKRKRNGDYMKRNGINTP